MSQSRFSLHCSLARIRHHLSLTTMPPCRFSRCNVHNYLAFDIIDNLVGKSRRKIVDKANKNTATRGERGPFSSELLSFSLPRCICLSAFLVEYNQTLLRPDKSRRSRRSKNVERFDGKQTSFRILKTFLLLQFFLLPFLRSSCFFITIGNPTFDISPVSIPDGQSIFAVPLV